MKAVLAAVAALAVGTPAAAGVIFSDDFNNAVYGGNVSPAGWTTTGGTVDALGPAYYGSLCTSAGGSDEYCVDLDGSTGDAGLMLQGFTLNAGVSYTASFDLAGDFRGGANSVLVTFGTSSNTYNLAANDAFTTYSLVFTPTSTGAYSLSFQNNGGDNMGGLLDNVEIASAGVPEPATWAMMLLGFGGLGAVLRGRRTVAA